MQKAQKISYILSILFVSPLRAVIILITPLLPLALKNLFQGEFNKDIIILYSLIGISSMIGLFRGYIDFANFILYIWICFPIVYLMFCDIRKVKPLVTWNTFLKSLRFWLIIIDLGGFICRFIVFRTVDDFGYLYGTHFKGVSGLSVVNAYVMLYYLSYILKGNISKKIILNFLFFFFSFIFCFSGLTVLTFAITIVIYLIANIKLRNLFKILIVLILSIIVLTYTAKDILDYNKKNIELFLDKDDSQNNARKRVMYYNFYELITTDMSVIFTGVGPGGYNSRTCFLINDDSDNIFTKLLGHHMPKYHNEYIYPLWNSDLVSYDSYTDGARNKPFSSFVAFGAEIGIIFLIIFYLFWFKRINKMRIESKNDTDYLYLFLLNTFVCLLLLTEYWFESSEFILYIIIQNIIISNKKYLNIKSI